MPVRAVESYIHAVRRAVEELAGVWQEVFGPQLCELRDIGGMVLLEGPGALEISEREPGDPVVTAGSLLSLADLEREITACNEEWVMPQEGIGATIAAERFAATWEQIGWPVTDLDDDGDRATAAEAIQIVAGALTGMSDDDVARYRPVAEEIIVLGAAKRVNASAAAPVVERPSMLLVVMVTDNPGDTEHLALHALNDVQRTWLGALLARRNGQ